MVGGRFALLEWMGGTADRGVFLTVRQGTQRAAIKLIVAEGSAADAYLSQWEITQSLTHPHLMPVLEFGRCSVEGVDVVYVVTEAAERVLSQFIQERALRSNDARDILGPILDTLSYLHSNGFVHGHLKPSNVLIVAEELKLSTDDLLLVRGVSHLSANRGIFDAPELDAGNPTAAADVWSLGMTLAEAMTQHLPRWEPSNPQEPPVPAGIPEPFSTIVRKCLRMDPAQRCSIPEIREMLLTGASAAPEPVAIPREPVARPTAAGQPANPVPEESVPSAPGPASRWRTDDGTPGPRLFEHIEDEPASKRRTAPWVFAGIVLLLIAVFGLLVTRTITFPWPFPNPIASAPAQPAQPESSAPAQAPSSGTAAAVPPLASSPQTPPAAGPVAKQAPAAANAPAAASTQTPPPAQSPAAPNVIPPSPPKTSLDSHAKASAPEPTTARTASGAKTAVLPAESRSPQNDEATFSRPANAKGAVAQKVMPSVSPNASASMHAPITVVLRVSVDRNGAVRDASYVSPGAGNYFARVAQRAAAQWKFDPPMRHGKAEPSVWIVRFYIWRQKIEATATEEGR